MKQQFVKTDDVLEAEKQCPWAMKMLRLEDGYMCFDESFEFYKFYNEWINNRLDEDWKNEKE